MLDNQFINKLLNVFSCFFEPR